MMEVQGIPFPKAKTKACRKANLVELIKEAERTKEKEREETSGVKNSKKKRKLGSPMEEQEEGAGKEEKNFEVEDVKVEQAMVWLVEVQKNFEVEDVKVE